MIYLKFTCFFTFLCLSNAVFSQKPVEEKLAYSFTVGLCYNALTSNNAIDVTAFARTPIEYRRAWQLHNQPSFTAGLVLKNNLTKKIATQIEFNLLSTRQKAVIDEEKTVNNNHTATVGNIQFSSLFLQIPLMARVKIGESSDVEVGIFGLFRLKNLGYQNLVKTVFSEQADGVFSTNNNPIFVYSPPKIVIISNQPAVFSTNFGALIGVNYRLNRNVALRLRYERELFFFSEYGDLFQSRLSASLLFKGRKLSVSKSLLRGLFLIEH